MKQIVHITDWDWLLVTGYWFQCIGYFEQSPTQAKLVYYFWQYSMGLGFKKFSKVETESG